MLNMFFMINLGLFNLLIKVNKKNILNKIGI